MAKTYNKMLMDVNGKIGDIVTEVQGDQNSRYLDINLFNNGIPIDLTGHTVRIYMRRPNTNPLEEFFNDGEITEATRGRCQFLLSTQALAKEGELEAQVSIWKGTEEILSTQVFKIMVTKKLRTSGSVESSNEYGALVLLFQNLYEAHDLMTTMVQNIGSPSSVAAQYNLDTMWQAWEFLTDYMKTDLTNMIEQALANASVQGVLDMLDTTTAKESTSQEILGKVNDVRARCNMTLFSSDDEIKLTSTITKDKAMKEDATTYYKVCSFIPKNSGAVRLHYSLTITIKANSYTGSAGSAALFSLRRSMDSCLHSVVDGTKITTSSAVAFYGNGTTFNTPSASTFISKSTTVGTQQKATGYVDVDVTQGIPVIVIAGYNGNDTFNGITYTGICEVSIAYKEVSW